MFSGTYKLVSQQFGLFHTSKTSSVFSDLSYPQAASAHAAQEDPQSRFLLI